MPPEPTAAPAEAQDPTADNPEPNGEKPAEDNPQAEAQVDYKAQYEEAQKVIGRQGHELSVYRRASQEPDADSEDAEPAEGAEQEAQPPAPYSAKHEAESWQLAEALYGGEAITAYEAAHPLLERAETPADYLAALEAYHAARSGATPAAAEAKSTGKGKTRAEAVQPRVDSNRSDAGPDPSIEKAFEEAVGKRDLRGFVSAATAAMGLGGSKRS